METEDNMGLRETLNNNGRITTGVTIGLVLVAGAFLAWQLGGSNPGDAPRTVFYTDDDGKTFFEDDATKFAPFDRNGKQAIRAYVYTCDDGKTMFVGYVERYKADALAKLNAAKEAGKLFEVPEQVTTEGAEIKKPGGSNWIPRTSPDAYKVVTPACPGGAGVVKMVG